MKSFLILIGLGLLLIGCSGADTGVTKEQEEAFRNPPKGGMPDDVRQKMEESRKKGEAMAAEARRQTEARNKAATTGG